MNRYTLEQRIAVEISSSKSGNEKLKSILTDVDAYSAALLRQAPVSGSLPPSLGEMLVLDIDEFLPKEHVLRRCSSYLRIRKKLIDDGVIGGNDR